MCQFPSKLLPSRKSRRRESLRVSASVTSDHVPDASVRRASPQEWIELDNTMLEWIANGFGSDRAAYPADALLIEANGGWKNSDVLRFNSRSHVASTRAFRLRNSLFAASLRALSASSLVDKRAEAVWTSCSSSAAADRHLQQLCRCSFALRVAARDSSPSR